MWCIKYICNATIFCDIFPMENVQFKLENDKVWKEGAPFVLCMQYYTLNIY